MKFFDIQGTSIEEYELKISPYSFRAKQLSSGEFNFSSTLFFGDCNFGIRSVSQDIEEKALIPASETLFIIPLTPTPINVCNRISTHSSTQYVKGSELYRHLPSGSVIGSISIQDDNILKYYPDEFCQYENTMKIGSGYMHTDKDSINSIITYIYKLFNLYLREQTISPQILRDTQDFIQRTLVSLICKDTQTNIRINSQKRWVEKAIEITQENTEVNYTVSDLALSCGVSPRGLQHAFKRILGISPRKYLSHARLKRIRYRLLNDETPKITKIAQDHGVIHMGNFSREYTLLFGENPSSTLTKNLNFK